MHFSGLRLKPLLAIVAPVCVWKARAAVENVRMGEEPEDNNHTNGSTAALPADEEFASAAVSTTTTTREFNDETVILDTSETAMTEATPPEKLPCYDNITILVEHMNFRHPSTPETYILCPNTVYTIGSEMNRGEKCCLDNQSPILSRSNTNIKCGDDGDPNNHCVLVGGALFKFFFPSPTGWKMMNILLWKVLHLKMPFLPA